MMLQLNRLLLLSMLTATTSEVSYEYFQASDECPCIDPWSDTGTGPCSDGEVFTEVPGGAGTYECVPCEDDQLYGLSGICVPKGYGGLECRPWDSDVENDFFTPGCTGEDREGKVFVRSNYVLV